MRTFRPAPTGSATPTTVVLTKTERPDTPNGMTDQPSRPDSHDPLLEDPDKSGHPWSHNPKRRLDTQTRSDNRNCAFRSTTLCEAALELRAHVVFAAVSPGKSATVLVGVERRGPGAR